MGGQLDLRPNGRKVSLNITRKLDNMYNLARKYCQFKTEICRIAFGDIRPESLRINDSNPCICIHGVMKAYKGFFNKVKQTSDGIPRLDHHMKRKKVVKMRAKVTSKLISKYNCASV